MTGSRARPRIGEMPQGDTNTIADVPGVRVGHATLAEGAVQTGVTAIRFHDGDHFRDKLPAASAVLNGFGKSVGLVQVDELGQIETPVLLTNTLSVGTAATALIRRAIAENPEIGRRTSTVNPVVFECNDGFLNDIQGLHVTEAHALAALDACTGAFARGAVGAGRGMSAYGFKGGIGTASRRLRLDDASFHLGALVLANFGRLPDLAIGGDQVGRRLAAAAANAPPERGSVIVVLATDVPLEHRQLRRVAMRAVVGLVRTGSYLGHGSGDIALAVSTAEPLRHGERRDLLPRRMLNENRIDMLFRAAAEATEDAVIDALFCAEDVVGRDGNRRAALAASRATGQEGS
jgi:D-aminopeptidase